MAVFDGLDENGVTVDTDTRVGRFRGKYGFLSNMYDCPVTYNGVTYSCSEAAYQAQRCARDEDRSKFDLLDGVSAKKLAKQVETKAGWNDIKAGVMKEILRAKFRQNKPLADKLLATGEKELVEGNKWYDTYWGVFKGKGENVLGKILMDVRDEIKKERVVEFTDETMATNKKFKFTGETKEVDGVTVHRIELLRDIQFTDGPNAGLPKFKAGRKGGWIQNEDMLSHDGNCWVADEAVVMNKAQSDCSRHLNKTFYMDKVPDNVNIYSYVCDDVLVYGSAKIVNSVLREQVTVGCDANITDSCLRETAFVWDSAQMSKSVIRGDSCVMENAQLSGSCVWGNARILGRSVIVRSVVRDNACVSGDSHITDSNLFENCRIEGGTVENTCCSGKSCVGEAASVLNSVLENDVMVVGNVEIRGRTLSSGIYNPEKIRQERISERIRQARLDAAKKRREKAEQKGANKTKGNKLA